MTDKVDFKERMYQPKLPKNLVIVNFIMIKCRIGLFALIFPNLLQHGCLLGWSKQGVLLLNACLTVRQAQANSHKDKGWETLTTAVVKAVNEKCSGVVFLLWGSYAQKKAELLNKQKHHLLKTVHPSPLSAHRGFLGSKHFSKCNEILVQHGKSPIDWAALDD